MKLGMVGLGRMGGNMTKRLENDGHAVQTYARSGGGTASSLEELVSQLEPRRAVWLMIPAGEPTEQAVQELLGLLDEGGESAEPGDWVLIHVGFAISKVDEAEAEATRKMLEGMGADYEAELEELKASVIE